MGSINVDFDFFDHPKVKRLIGRLGRGAEVLPIRLWCYCGRYHYEDGRLAGYTATEIEQLIGWWGKEGDGIKGLLGLFLHEIEGGYQVHGWLEYQGHIAASKSRSKKMTAARWRKLADVGAASSPASNPPRVPASNAPSNPSAMQCNAVQGNRDADAARNPPSIASDKTADGGGDDLDLRIATWIGENQISARVVPCPVVFRDFRQLVESAGWDQACSLVLQMAARREVVKPVAVALAKFAREQGQRIADQQNSVVMTQESSVDE